MRDIGKNIKALRLQKNMTQDELAEKLFVTRQTVSNYETGRSRPDVDMLARIAEVLKTDANTVLYGLPVQTNKKSNFLAAIIGAGLIALLALPLPWLDDLTGKLQGMRFLLWPRYLLVVYYLPLMLLCTGWETMQVLSLFTKLTPLPAQKTNWLFRCCILFITFYVFMTILVIFPFSKPRWLQYFLYFILGAWPRVSLNWAYLLLPVGSLLWLCGFPKKQ